MHAHALVQTRYLSHFYRNFWKDFAIHIPDYYRE